MNTREKRNAEHQAGKLMLEAAKELDRAAERIKEYEPFVNWLNNKPEYKHIYQQYLQIKYP